MTSFLLGEDLIQGAKKPRTVLSQANSLIESKLQAIVCQLTFTFNVHLCKSADMKALSVIGILKKSIQKQKVFKKYSTVATQASPKCLFSIQLLFKV